MSVLTAPPKTTKTSFRAGDVHIGVWALQKFLNTLEYGPLLEDGDFGGATEKAIKRYQRATNATVDGIVGPQTQERIVRSCVVRAPHGKSLPRGLAEGLIDGESGRLLAAVNWSVPGGVDCGLTQQRVYGPPYGKEWVVRAFNPLTNVADAVGDLYNSYKNFVNMSYVERRKDRYEYAWRLAALNNNWPWGAQELSKGYKLSTTKTATWVPSSVKFADGKRVITWSEWAQKYAMGSKTHRDPGLVTKLAFGVPSI